LEIEIAPQIGIVGYAYQQLSCESGSGDRVGCLGSHVLGIGPQIIPMGKLQFRTFNNGQVRGPAPHGDASARLPSVEPYPAHTRGEYHAPAQPSSTSRWP
jgi:hypothetical protein